MRAPESLSALLAPRSVAVLGASGRPGRPGYQVVRALSRDGGPAVHPVTPRYEEVAGVPCVADLSALAGPVDLAVVASGPERIEADVTTALEHGARSLLVFGAVPARRDAEWLARIGALARDADVPLLGPDSLGYVDFASRSAATWALPAVGPGGVALISQSGTIYWEANTNDPRLGFSFTAHTGMEVSVTIADLLAHAVSQPQTSVVGLYVETIRDPDGFVAALELAAARQVPVVAMFAGRTSRSRAQMTTHAGRLAGDRAAFEALFRRHGVACAETQDELWTTLALLGSGQRAGDGGLAAIMDSGGGVALFLDFAEELGVPLAPLFEATRAQLGTLLGLEEVGNPVDFWAGEADLGAHTGAIVGALAADESTGLVLVFTTFAEAGEAGFAPAIAHACRDAAAGAHVPVVAATYTSRQLHGDLMHELARAGVPTLDGMRTALLAVRHAFAHRDFAGSWRHASRAAEAFDPVLLAAWRDALAATGVLAEAEALALLGTAGIPTAPVRRAQSEDEAVTAAAELGFPVVLKTDEGVTHKAALGGVRLGLQDAAAVRAAYADVAGRLGPRVVVAPMLAGVEVALGIVAGQFGPNLMVATGGTDIEALRDRRYLLAPTSPAEVRAALAELHAGRLLAMRFGPDSRALDELCAVAARLASLGWALRDAVSEIDLNPVLVGEQGCVAVDALVAGVAGEASIAAAAAASGGEGERV
jgi:acyl-CoA synthetase (NDP forming)